jgi:hypothetical protein
MKRPSKVILASLAALALSLLLMVSVASAEVLPGTYLPTSDSFNSANAPGSSNLKSGTPECTVNEDRSIDCNPYVLSGVGHTDAFLRLTASWTATVDCWNPAGGKNTNNPIESHQSDFSDSSGPDTITSGRNGQLRVPAKSTDPASVGQVCPNPNWRPVIREGTLTLVDFEYTLTFEGFSSPYITINESNPA